MIIVLDVPGVLSKCVETSSHDACSTAECSICQQLLASDNLHVLMLETCAGARKAVGIGAVQS